MSGARVMMSEVESESLLENRQKQKRVTKAIANHDQISMLKGLKIASMSVSTTLLGVQYRNV